MDVLKVTVTDAFGTPVAGAMVREATNSSTTDDRGIALLLVDGSKGSAQLNVSRETFMDKSVAAPVAAGQANEIALTLDRATSAAGGALTSRSGVLPTVDGTARQLTFEIELVIVDGGSQAIDSLKLADFTLRACTPDAANNRVDCLRGAGADADVAYVPLQATPEAMALIPGGPAMPYAATLLMDQSGSILQSDPTGARLFSAKAFLGGLGADDQALVAAFASGPSALIPTPPLAVYGPFRNKVNAPSYFPTLDSLAPLVGGETPLYDSADALRQQVISDGSLPAGLAKALVIFTDGADTYCGGTETCRTRRAQSILSANTDGVRLFTIGLSSGVDIVALGELANQTGGALLYADSPEQLLPLYGSAGKLLSLSLPTYRLRWTVQAGSGVFQPGSTLVGRVQVTTTGSTFDVPFIVGIP
ncbi:MAG: vWA domain-containing protein [Pseudomonadota bacterium]